MNSTTAAFLCGLARRAALAGGFVGLLAASLLSTSVRAQTSAESTGRGRMIAVLDVQTTGVPASLGALLTDVVAAEVQALGRHEVLTGAELRSAVGGLDDMPVGCTDAECVATLVGAAGATESLASHVGRVGDTYVVHIKLIDVAAVRAVRRVYETVEGGDDALLLTTVKSAVRKLFGNTQVVGEAVAPFGPTVNVEAAAARIDPFAWVPLGCGAVAAAALGVGGYFGAQTLKHRRAAEQPRGRQVELREAASNRRAANIAYGVGAATAVAGLATGYWFLWGRSRDHGETDGPFGDVALAPVAYGAGVGLAASLGF